ncbi:DUF7504 family protein [Halorussus litoreus]|uniref:DUF7504 family protein n=1 Tax=Halorussus litoreus TaxID=1710536 RepID=UPI000E225A20|nr:hypothetical protein [Halorussus litoreus]
MSQRARRKYRFGDDLPIDGVDPGTNLLVAGPAMSGARRLAIRLVTDGNDRDEGMVFVTTNKSGERLLSQCDELCGGVNGSQYGVVDCVSRQQGRDQSDDHVALVSSPSDLTGIGIEFSGLYRDVHANGCERVRAGLYSLSTLLMYAEFRTISRFVHTIGGRIDAADGLGVFLIDPTTQDERVISTIAQFCDARVDVRDDDGARELRVRGLDSQSREWNAF